VAAEAETLAGIIVEPLQRLIPPEPGFLQGLRDICDRHGLVLIFDEVVTGFRLAYGGAQALYDVTPDLCTLGKIIGGGFPLAAVAGRAGGPPRGTDGPPPRAIPRPRSPPCRPDLPSAPPACAPASAARPCWPCSP